MPEINCEKCGAKFTVAESNLGKRMRCSSCKHVFTAALGDEPIVDLPPAGSDRAAADSVRRTEERNEPARERRERESDRDARSGRNSREGSARVRPNDQMLLRVLVLLCGLSGAVIAGLLANRFYEEQKEGGELAKAVLQGDKLQQY